MEEKERLLAVDKDIADEEDEEIVKKEATDLKDPVRGAQPWERKLVCVDETSKVLTLRVLCYINNYSMSARWI